MNLPIMLPKRNRALELFLDEIYDAALEPRRLGEALQLFLDAFGADDGRIFISDRLSVPPGKARAVEFAHGPIRRAGALDLGPQALDALLSAVTTDSAGTLEDETMGSLHYLSVVVAAGDRRFVRLVALRRSSAFTEQDQRDCEGLAEDLRRAFVLHRKASGSTVFAVGNLFFGANAAALFVTRQKVVEHTNTAAVQLLERQGPVQILGRTLSFEDLRVQAALDELARHGPGNEPSPTTRGFASVLTEPSGLSWLAQLSRHEAPPVSLFAAEPSPAPVVLVALVPFRGPAGSRDALIDGFVDLTGAERSVFSALVDGKDIATIAADTRRSVETVRWHVRNLFSKLHVNSQADLARLGSLLLPI